MKPKNRIWCPDCNRPKMLFETERKANDFIKWNGEDLATGSETLRAYYCPSCCGWHISHRSYKPVYESRTDELIGAYRRMISKKGTDRIDRLLTNKGETVLRMAENIFKELPEEIRTVDSKNALRNAVSLYFSQNGIHDECGDIRREIYRIWREKKGI